MFNTVAAPASTEDSSIDPYRFLHLRGRDVEHVLWLLGVGKHQSEVNQQQEAPAYDQTNQCGEKDLGSEKSQQQTLNGWQAMVRVTGLKHRRYHTSM